ncbi:alpha/beta hydrolase [Paenibacillus senegalensis]|uniref:alpha/beta hydrolase n=1 Tax=Paenibacillus senegalensis TaxID=1465766 RepID=UPI000288C821|nr:alpha/beta hydrolase-fold protein [Paenibacillus senegalensis]
MSEQNIYHRKIVKKQLHSEALNTTRDYWVYLPPGYNELTTYHVVYCQDGLEFLNFGRIATITNRLIIEENMQPIIIAGLHVDMPNRTEEYSPDGVRYPAYRQFWTEEFIPEIERDFPVGNTRSERVLAGDSLGATVSLHLALDYPDHYSQILSLSGAFLEPTRQRLQQERDLSWLELYQLIGLQETAVPTQRGTFDFLSANREAKQLLEEKSAAVNYVEAEGKHIWGFWQKHLPAGLLHFFS